MKKKLTHNLGLKLISLALAFVLWYLVVQINDPTDSVSFNNVQVRLVNTELLEETGKVYEVLEGTDKARVKIYAPRSVISQIRETDIVAEADVSKLTEINTIVINYDVENATVERIESNQEVVRLNVEEKVRKWIKLISNTVGEVAEGYMIYNTSLDQTNIEISGPKSAVANVDYAAVEMGVTGATTGLSANVDIQLFDTEGKRVTHDQINKNVNSAYMTVDVLATKSVPIEVKYSGEVAEGYMPTGLVESSITEVMLAAKPSVLDNISVIAIPEERMDISGAEGNVQEIINLKEYLPDSVKFADKSFNGKVTATVYVEPIVSRDLEVPIENITFTGIPQEYEVEWIGNVENYNLTIYGLWEYINSVQQETITGSVDVAAYMAQQGMEEMVQGEYIVPVSFNLTENIRVDEELSASVRFVIPEDEE